MWFECTGVIYHDNSILIKHFTHKKKKKKKWNVIFIVKAKYNKNVDI